MKCVVIISPYRGDVKLNRLYAQVCCLDALSRGEAPLAGHLFFTLLLDDDKPAERKLGMEAGRSWMWAADYVAVYDNLGVSAGMEEDIAFAVKHNMKVVHRSLSESVVSAVRRIAK